MPSVRAVLAPFWKRRRDNKAAYAVTSTFVTITPFAIVVSITPTCSGMYSATTPNGTSVSSRTPLLDTASALLALGVPPATPIVMRGARLRRSQPRIRAVQRSRRCPTLHCSPAGSRSRSETKSSLPSASGVRRAATRMRPAPRPEPRASRMILHAHGDCGGSGMRIARLTVCQKVRTP